jgi:S-adenosyl-L-methionine hydrolase (adenosine-forming)
VLIPFSAMPPAMRPLITLTTDFGMGSHYVAQMKGAILSLVREVDLVDISHEIGPQNVREGAVSLADATPRFPPGTIHVAVVDPGVGTARRLLYVEIGGQRYLAPDNGLLSYLLLTQQPQRIVALANRRFWLPEPAHTFHGRDILAPVAAHLALGVDPAELGPALATGDLVALDWPQPRCTHERIDGEVLYVDSFGNLIANIRRELVESLGNLSSLVVGCGNRQIQGIVATYGAALPGERVALFDSQGRLEVAVVDGSAARDLRLGAGAAVVVQSTVSR